MRYLTKTILIVCAIIMVAGCKKEGEPDVPTAQEEAFEKLSGNWTLGTSGKIKLDERDVSGNYAGFMLSFNDGGYTTTNAGTLFNATGTWAWSNPQAGDIILDGGRLITINNLTTTQFVISFAFSGTGGARAGTAGNYVITVVK